MLKKRRIIVPRLFPTRPSFLCFAALCLSFFCLAGLLSPLEALAAPGYDEVAGSASQASQKEVTSYGMTPIRCEDIADGEYDISADSSSPFFKIESAHLSVKDGEMTARLTMSSYSYLYVYMGTAEEAAKADLEDYIPAVDVDSWDTFTIPVEALDKAIDCAAYSKKKKKWYPRKILLHASDLPAEALDFSYPDYDKIEEAVTLYDEENSKETIAEQNKVNEPTHNAATQNNANGATQNADRQSKANGSSQNAANQGEADSQAQKTASEQNASKELSVDTASGNTANSSLPESTESNNTVADIKETTLSGSAESGSTATGMDEFSAFGSTDSSRVVTSTLKGNAVSMKESDGEYSIEVDLTGGSGRASVTSPTWLHIKKGKGYATLLWSSSYYDYMIVDGMTYTNETTDGSNSTFTIPILKLDEPITVIADTTAMGDPVEIEYTLTFYSDSVGSKNRIPQESTKRVIIAALVIMVIGGIVNVLLKKRRRA